MAECPPCTVNPAQGTVALQLPPIEFTEHKIKYKIHNSKIVYTETFDFLHLHYIKCNFVIEKSNINALKEYYYDNKGKSACFLQNVIREVRFEEG